MNSFDKMMESIKHDLEIDTNCLLISLQEVVMYKSPKEAAELLIKLLKEKLRSELFEKIMELLERVI